MHDSTAQPRATMSQAYARQAHEAQQAPARIALLVARFVVSALWAIVIAITLLLVAGFLLQLLGANPDAGFVDWVYRSTDQIMEPFRGVFEPRAIDDRSVFDPSMLLAAVVYVLVVLVVEVTVLRWVRGQIQRRDAQISELQVRAQDAATMEYLAAQQAQRAQVPGTATTVTQTTVTTDPLVSGAAGPSSLAPLVEQPQPPAGPQHGTPGGWPV